MFVCLLVFKHLHFLWALVQLADTVSQLTQQTRYFFPRSLHDILSLSRPHTCLCSQMKAQNPRQCHLLSLYTSLLETDFPAKVEVLWFSWTRQPRRPGDTPVFTLPCAGESQCHIRGFHLGAGDPNLGLGACTVSSLSTEPFPQAPKDETNNKTRPGVNYSIRTHFSNYCVCEPKVESN